VHNKNVRTINHIFLEISFEDFKNLIRKTLHLPTELDQQIYKTVEYHQRWVKDFLFLNSCYNYVSRFYPLGPRIAHTWLGFWKRPSTYCSEGKYLLSSIWKLGGWSSTPIIKSKTHQDIHKVRPHHERDLLCPNVWLCMGEASCGPRTAWIPSMGTMGTRRASHTRTWLGKRCRGDGAWPYSMFRNNWFLLFVPVCAAAIRFVGSYVERRKHVWRYSNAWFCITGCYVKYSYFI
jgi:hypothetical protein